LLHAHQQGDPAVCDILRRLRYFTTASPDEILSADVTLAEVQYALAQDYGFTSWRALKQYVEQADPRRYLHVFCVEIPALALRESGVPGTVMLWLDPLIEGPALSGVTEEEWLRLRARQLTEIFPTPEQAIQALQNMDRQLAEFHEYVEVVLWFDACLYDQVVLCRQLDWFSRRTPGSTRLSLICIGEYTGMPAFHGLGELSNEELAGLLPARHAVTSAQIRLGVAAWQAYRSPDPTAVEQLLAGDTAPLPYLAPALLKHLERFPSVRNGVNRLEQEILELVAGGEGRLYEQLFFHLSDMEQPAYFGVEYLMHQLEALCAGPHPLLTRSLDASAAREPWPAAHAAYALTPAGEAVLHGRADWIALNGIDRWLGGVHLHGARAEWRWNAQQRKLERMS